MPEIEKRYVIAVDLHGTLVRPIMGGGLHCTERPLSNAAAELFLGIGSNMDSGSWESRVGNMARGNIETFRDLPLVSSLKRNFFPKLHSPREIGKYVEDWDRASRKLFYRMLPEQEESLQLLAVQPDVFCTLVSATPVKFKDQVWEQLGIIGREAMNKDNQMMLRKDTYPMMAKVVSVAVLALGLDQTPEQRAANPNRQVLIVDDDPNFLETACRLFYEEFDVIGFSPTIASGRRKYPKLELPDCLKRRSRKIYWGYSLREVAMFIDLSKSIDKHREESKIPASPLILSHL